MKYLNFILTIIAVLLTLIVFKMFTSHDFVKLDGASYLDKQNGKIYTLLADVTEILQTDLDTGSMKTVKTHTR